MNFKKEIFSIALVFILLGSAFGQTTERYSDDRELFIGVPSSGVMPNIVILADSSNSMRTAIYHPDYKPSYAYNHTDPLDPSTPELTLDGFVNVGFTDGILTDTYSITSNITFDICGASSGYRLEYDYRATFNGQAKNNPRRWNITALSGSWTNTNVQNKKVSWGCANTPNSCTSFESVTIINVVSTDPLVIEVNPRINPPVGATIYINPRWVLQDVETAALVPVGSNCVSLGYTTKKAANVKLHGVTWSANGTDYTILYEKNYLYWMAFYANAAQLAQVTHWATTGAFKHDSTGNDIQAGYYRMRVLQDVLKDVITDLWTRNTNYNFGLYRLSKDGGAEQLNNLQNANSPGVLNSFRGSIDGIVPDTGTPLAEALADIWVYFKCGQNCDNYMPESETNIGGCGAMSGSSGHPETACPIQYICQKNYVIIMTDGQTSSDYFNESKYEGSIFRQPVADWGDGDAHDPATWDGVQPDFSDYCKNQSCWYNAQFQGTDFLDDVAYYLKNNDIFPDAIRPEFTGMQNVETFAIGFTMDNDLLEKTAQNGNGEYYTAGDYGALKAALASAITNIMLRNFAFASYTAPKRVTTAVGEGATFIGYFMPSGKEIWDGHLQSYTLYDKWFADADANGALSAAEQGGTPYELKATCQSISGKTCLQVVSMAPLPNWDAADKLSSLTGDRSIWTLDTTSGTPVALNFTAAASIETLHDLFQLSDATDPSSADPLLDRVQTRTIVNTIANKMNFGDVFHSDIAYAGPPLRGKIYLQNYNPGECNLGLVDTDGLPTDMDCYQKFRLDHIARRKVLYVGTNIGMIHMIDANIPDPADPATANGGKEIWGFIPDEVLPSLKKLAIDPKQFTFTTDGRITADDIYIHGAASDPWKTILAFGLKDGGRSFYALDITHVQAAPTFLWKFMDSTYSGNSWSKPLIGKIRFFDGTSTYDRWVVIVAGGKAFNNENTADSMGKAVFVLDAATGDVIWMVGFNNASGAADSTSTPELDVNSAAYVNPLSRPSGVMHLTKDAAFNYCVPSAISAVDKDNNGRIDALYFGNVAGHLFKTNLTNADPASWKTTLLYKTNLATPVAAGTITAITAATPSSQYKLNVTAGTFVIGQNVLGETSKAMGFITDISGNINNLDYLIQTTSAESFVLNETISVKAYDPIFISPAIHKDLCMHYWVSFGTGDRLRSRTNTAPGKFVSIIDGAGTPSQLTLSNLVVLTFSTTTDTFSGSADIVVDNKYGWYFNFPNTANGEKLFDPDPIVLPDSSLLPHIFFNTYQYVPTTTSSTDCNAPSSGSMHFYEIVIDYCKGGLASGYREEGRISGGGMMEGSEYVMIEGGSDVGSVDLPGLGSAPKILPKPLPYTGGLIFLKEKKR